MFITKNSLRALAIAGALVPGAFVATATPAPAQVGISISVGIAPPALPIYTQPPCPTPGYLWTPGYWGYNNAYYWVPGAWAQPPAVGVLWTPPYWGFAGGAYGFHAGYWGPSVGFYGGINYGFGYGGVGFNGGFWQGNAYHYNTAFANVDRNVVHNTYVRNVNLTNNYNHVSYNGGPNGVRATATSAQLAAYNDGRRYGATSYQQHQYAAARADHGQYVGATGARPATYAMSTDRSGFGYGNEVDTRQGNQQSRISHGIRNGSIVRGGAQNLENRENSIHDQARSDRAANGGALTSGEKQHINTRQNRVSNSIYNDKHNGINDRTAAARQGTTVRQQHQAAHQVRAQQRPEGPHDHR